MDFIFENMVGLFTKDGVRARPVSLTGLKQNVWEHNIQLDELKTKPENLNVKVSKDQTQMTVTGESLSESMRSNGLKISSVNTWMKVVDLPENIETSTLSCKFNGEDLVFTAEYKTRSIPVNIQ